MSAAANSAVPEPLELEIYSLSFRLRAPRDEHERLQRAARHVDTVMRELVSGQPSADTTRLAIQAAFLIAGDYFRSLDEKFAGKANPNQVISQVDDILKGLDIALARMDSALLPLEDAPPPARTSFIAPAEPEPEVIADEEPQESPSEED